MIYLDDILIYSDSIAEHKDHVREVLQQLRINGLFASPNKCVLHCDKVEFLGFILGPHGVQMDDSKVSVIQEWPTPRRLKDIQAFLGFANFYRCFIHSYSRIATPLIQLTHKSVSWNWSLGYEQAFQELKKAFTQALVLTHWNPNSPIVLETDTSDSTLAAILSTYIGKELHPIAFYSRAFNTTEQNYDIHDKELLAIFEAFKKWRHYLEGTPTPVGMITDHKNLIYFCDSKNLTRWQAHWLEYLSQFNLLIRFCPGILSSKPDTLTRRWDVYAKGNETSSPHLQLSNQQPIFQPHQLSTWTKAGWLSNNPQQQWPLLDNESLYLDIRDSLPTDPASTQPQNKGPNKPSNDWLMGLVSWIALPGIWLATMAKSIFIFLLLLFSFIL